MLFHFRPQEVSSHLCENNFKNELEIKKSQREIRGGEGGNNDFEARKRRGGSGEKADERGDCCSEAKISCFRKLPESNKQPQPSLSGFSEGSSPLYNLSHNNCCLLSRVKIAFEP